jgi:hypothetical protein
LQSGASAGCSAFALATSNEKFEKSGGSYWEFASKKVVAGENALDA